MEREDRIFPTYIKELDINIGTDIEDRILQNLCKTSKYINSICPDIWIRKIKLLYPDLPIPNKNTAKEEYFSISDSYLKLKEFAEAYNYEEILDWLELPINHINVIIEFSPLLNNYLWEKRGSMWNYVRNMEDNLLNYLMNEVYPEQRSVDVAFVNKNRTYIIILAEYGIFPSLELIDREGERGYFIPELIQYNLIPSQESVNIATENGFVGVIALIKYNIYPSQEAVNIAALNRHDSIIGWLSDEGIFPDQTTINIIAENAFYEIIKELAENGKFPDQRTINHLDNIDILALLVRYEKYPN